MGEFPVSILSEEILTEDPESIKAIIVIVGNPVLSTPNRKILIKAFQNYNFLQVLTFIKTKRINMLTLFYHQHPLLNMITMI